jgi:hypothetical protein
MTAVCDCPTWAGPSIGFDNFWGFYTAHLLAQDIIAVFSMISLALTIEASFCITNLGGFIYLWQSLKQGCIWLY